MLRYMAQLGSDLLLQVSLQTKRLCLLNEEVKVSPGFKAHPPGSAVFLRQVDGLNSLMESHGLARPLNHLPDRSLGSPLHMAPP